MSLQILKVRQLNLGEEMGMTIETIGGKSDGEVFKLVEAALSNGDKINLFENNGSYFKRVLVPWDFEHSELI